MGNFSLLEPFLGKLARGEKVRIGIIGGSVPWGVECVETYKNKGVDVDASGLFVCSYIVRLIQTLRSMSASNITLVNLCTRAATSDVHADRLQYLLTKQGAQGLVDIIFVDTLVNDRGGYIASYEMLVRLLHELSPPVAIFGILISNLQQISWVEWMKTKQAHAQILAHYNLPRLDLVELVTQHPWIWEFDEVTQLGKFVHPGWRTHQLVADLISNMLGRHWATCCQNRQPLTQLAYTLPYDTWGCRQCVEDLFPCSERVTDYSAYNKKDEVRAQLVSGDWSVKQDVPGKPGWIATQEGSEVRFRMSFGQHPKLRISYMRSYQDMGDIELFLLSQPERKARLEGLWGEHASNGRETQMQLAVIGRSNLSMAPGGSDTLVAISRPGRKAKGQGPWTKSKLILLTSC